MPKGPRFKGAADRQRRAAEARRSCASTGATTAPGRGPRGRNRALFVQCPAREGKTREVSHCDTLKQWRGRGIRPDGRRAGCSACSPNTRATEVDALVSAPLRRDVRFRDQDARSVDAPVPCGWVETSQCQPLRAEIAMPDAPRASRLSWTIRPQGRIRGFKWHAYEHARSGKKRPVLLEVFGNPSCPAGRAPRDSPVAATSGRYRSAIPGDFSHPGLRFSLAVEVCASASDVRSPPRRSGRNREAVVDSR